MKRRDFCKGAGTAIAATAWGGISGASAGKRKKNVLLIVADDMNCRFGCYGDPTVQSPNIDALAARGVRFDNACCQYPVCNPSRASMMTGLYIDQIKVWDLHTHFRKTVPKVVTLPQHFKNNGYFTARAGKIYHQGVPRDVGRRGLDDEPSWHEVRDRKGRDKTEESEIFSFTPGKFGATPSWRSIDCSDNELSDGMIADEVIDMMRTHKDEPFFLAAGFYRPHTPYVAPKKYFDMYPLDKVPLPDPIPKGAVGYSMKDDFIRRRKFEETFTDKDKRNIIRAYFAAASYMDAQVGRLLDELKRLKLEDDTIVVFWGDHGYSLGEHNHWQKQTLYHDDARCPFIIAGPGIPGGDVCKRPVEMIDAYPTLAAACGLDVPDWLAGKDLAPQLQNPDTPTDRPALSQSNRHFPGYSIRTERYRFTEYPPRNKWRKRKWQLFDHQNDPHEWHNLVDDPKHAKTVAELREALNKHPGKGATAPAVLK